MKKIVHWLLPKEEKFYNMLDNQANNVVNGAEELRTLIGNFDRINDSERALRVKKINDIESDGDEITHKIIATLDKTFITPIDKEDIHHLAILLDDVLDLINATAKRLIIFKINAVDIHIRVLTDIILEIAKKTKQGINNISDMKELATYYIDAHTLENKADDEYYIALSNVFEKNDVVEIIKFKAIYEFLESTIDKCEDIANVIESIVVKHA